MSLKSQIQTEHDSRISTPFDREPYCRGQRKGSNSLAMFLAIFLAASFLGCFAYYSQMFITLEYGQQSSNTEQFDLLSKKLPEHCKLLQFRNLEGARKLGCL